MMNQITENYIHYKKYGKAIVFRVDIHLIGGCNFRCVMCDNWKQKIELNFSFEDLQKYLLVLKKYYNCNYVRFHGQEPSLYHRLEDLVLFAKKLGMKVAIKTNGRLINNQRFSKLLVAGLDELYLSIDGPDEKTHDTIRGMPGSFLKNVDLIKKGKKINPNLKIYINSVVMKSNFKNIDMMVDFGKKYSVDRVSFVFLNDKNRKDIDDINLSREDFYNFFKQQVVTIYKKSEFFNISVDFSPFLSNLIGQSSEKIIQELTHNFHKYQFELEAFYNGEYGKYFYDKYGCFGPLDHASINFNGDMYGCCVVERASSNAVGNILSESLSGLWETKKYRRYRENSNEFCSYSEKCASNFYTRKNLFKDIYGDDILYDKENPISYYRYLKAFQNEPEDVKNKILLSKLIHRVVYFYDNLSFYRHLLIQNGLQRKDVENAGSFDILNKLPILNKAILAKNYTEIKSLSVGYPALAGKTSGNSGNKLEFFYPLDFKRYIKQIAIFSEEFGFTYKDAYFSLTPTNCNQVIINKIEEPEYVKKIYLPTTHTFDYDKKYFLSVSDIFNRHKNIPYIHTDSKYLLYIILGFQKYHITFPHLKGISLSYSYTNRSLKEFIKKELNCIVSDNYGCSEVGPISVEQNGEKKVFGDNGILEEIDENIIMTDLDNMVFPFIRYQNDDKGKYEKGNFTIVGKRSQELHGKSLKEIDEFFYENFPQIIAYQFIGEEIMHYIAHDDIPKRVLEREMLRFFGIPFSAERKTETFFEIGGCSKFKTII